MPYYCLYSNSLNYKQKKTHTFIFVYLPVLFILFSRSKFPSGIISFKPIGHNKQIGWWQISIAFVYLKMSVFLFIFDFKGFFSLLDTEFWIEVFFLQHLQEVVLILSGTHCFLMRNHSYVSLDNVSFRWACSEYLLYLWFFKSLIGIFIDVVPFTFIYPACCSLILLDL